MSYTTLNMHVCMVCSTCSSLHNSKLRLVCNCTTWNMYTHVWTMYIHVYGTFECIYHWHVHTMYILHWHVNTFIDMSVPCIMMYMFLLFNNCMYHVCQLTYDSMVHTLYRHVCTLLWQVVRIPDGFQLASEGFKGRHWPGPQPIQRIMGTCATPCYRDCSNLPVKWQSTNSDDSWWKKTIKTP